MIYFFSADNQIIYAIDALYAPDDATTGKLHWLMQGAALLPYSRVEGYFNGPRKEMITPWSTNAVEITQNMGIQGIRRIEVFRRVEKGAHCDPMLESIYENLDQAVFHVSRKAEPIRDITDIADYNQAEGLALSQDEVAYLEALSEKLGRPLTDSEVFGFSQVNSEHCRHKIFNGTFIIDGEEMPLSLFGWIRRTSREHPNFIVSAYKDNVAFIAGPDVWLFSPARQDKADWFRQRRIPSVLSLKAETHNFPTTVEPFNGAATGSGGEIRDRMAGGQASFPMAGTAVYMTSYSRLEAGRRWESHTPPRPWLYHEPAEILIKASNGASDFGNKFGQPLICGSLLTLEQNLGQLRYGFDKVIMLAGGIGYAHRDQSLKQEVQAGDRIIVMGGDNYRIGMGGGAVSSVSTGQFSKAIELNAVQRSNPEMQKRVYNAIRAMAEQDSNPIRMVHDHGAGGHLNALSELVESHGGRIDLRKLPVGDPTLSAREIIGNESQERMGLVVRPEDEDVLRKVAERERAPMYDVGEVGHDQRFVVEDASSGRHPIDLHLLDMFGKPPQTVLQDHATDLPLQDLVYKTEEIGYYLEDVLQQEAVACKDWLTNKVDRSVTGRIALQQCTGELQLPLNDFGLVALDMTAESGMATSIGHAPLAAQIDPAAGSRLAVAEALTNLVLAPLKHGLMGVSLSANWMWPARQTGENARLYQAVKAISDFAVSLGINIPTGKDSLSMTQHYPDGSQVRSPGTVIVSSVAETGDVRMALDAALRGNPDAHLVYIPFTLCNQELGGTALAQTLGQSGTRTADIPDPAYFRQVFEALQTMVNTSMLLAGHDVSAGGLVTCLLEMAFPTPGCGLEVDSSMLAAADPVTALFAEIPAVVVQTSEPEAVLQILHDKGLEGFVIAKPVSGRHLVWRHKEWNRSWDIDTLRNRWYRTSYLLDRMQSGDQCAAERAANYMSQPLHYSFPKNFEGSLSSLASYHQHRAPSGTRAAIIREKGVNGDREMAYALYLAGFDVKDIHMTDLISGREDLQDVNMIVFVGGFSNSDVLGSARGWAGAFLYNEKARQALDAFYEREDTLSLGVCNGCQLMMALGLIPGRDGRQPVMHHNASGKFESAFLTVDIAENNTVMLSGLGGSRLGIWVAHGEGRFELPGGFSNHIIPMTYGYHDYPGNPNGSEFAAAAVASPDGRHLAMMPHLERAFLPWQWAWYPSGRRADEATPWLQAFVAAREWIKNKTHTP